ncbi:MAG: helicase [Bacteroidales bacterium]|nr:helicase [Bacteroidales bacterium]
MARIYDNIETKFTQGLNDIITEDGVKRVDFCVGYFNLRGWNLVVNTVDNIEGDYVYEGDNKKFRCCRLLIGMYQPPRELVRWLYTDEKLPDEDYARKCRDKIAYDFKQQLTTGFQTSNDEKVLRRLSTQLKKGKVCVKLYVEMPLHAKLYLAYRPNANKNKILAILGSSNLTYAGLKKQAELDSDIENDRDTEALAQWFDDRWNDRFCIDITQELIKIIDSSWASEVPIRPYYIYLKTAYHLSEDARNGIKEFTLTQEFRNELFDFQQTAVKIAARHLNSEKRGGAMIGDVVGLGKTITACAIAKIYEMTFASSTLIVCPANLQAMWEKYRRRYDLKADIVSMAKPIDVDNARYYRLIIVDESHNLRNTNGIRYQNIKRLIERQDSKVLLLTATPYNKDFADLAAQLKLFISEDDDLGIRPEEYIRSLGGDRAFMQRHSEVFIRSIKAFEQSDKINDWQELMKLFLVRRTRTFIKDNYAKTDPANGRKYLEFRDGHKSYFPERIPKAIKFDTVPGDQYSRLYSDEMIAIMENLKLPRYGLSQYADAGKTANAPLADRQLLDNLSRAGQRMMGFCKSTFFKRIDSSGYAFLLTLYRHILRNAVFIYAIENQMKLPIGDENSLPEEYLDDEDMNNVFGQNGDETNDNAGSGTMEIPTDMKVYMTRAKNYYNILTQKRNVAWIDSVYFKRTMKQDLKHDCEKIIEMIQLCGKWDPQTDQKLNCLERLLKTTHKDDKVLIFTQYSDTAKYIYGQLKNRGFDHIDCATGDSENPTAIVERFSPISNKRTDIAKSDETRVLVATDVLSEGQNLQDAHVIVNFDLPWAIIRLIQRAGRVDRIDQSSEKIYCYSFFPTEGVEKIISLRKRLNDRINSNASLVGSDERFFEGNETNLSDMYNEKSGSLDDDEDDSEVDLASQAYQIWKNATDANPELKQIIPSLSNMIYSTKQATSADEDGVITYVKTHNGYDVLSWYNSRGEILSQSQRRILQAMACNYDTAEEEPLENRFELVKKAVRETDDKDTRVSGILGNRFSTRYRIIELLEHYYQQPPNLLFDADKKQLLKKVIDDIYNYQLLDETKIYLSRVLHTNAADEIVESVLEMHKNNSLCRIDEERDTEQMPEIICSMGLKYQ